MFKKITIYGEDWVGTLPRLLADELSIRGFSVQVFDYTNILPGIKNRNFWGRLLRRLFESHYVNVIRKNFFLEVELFKPDLIIICKGYHLNIKVLSDLKLLGARVINWNPDDFFNMKNSCSELIDAIKIYDVIVSPRPHLFDKYRAYGAKELIYLDWYFVPNLHHPHEDTKIEYLISFVGSWSPFRERFIDEINARVNVWGAGWEKSAFKFRKNNNVSRVILSQVEMSKVFASSKLNLNLLTKENSDVSNLRFFEVPASGGLLLTERNAHASRHLEDQKDCLMFQSPADINFILSKNLNFDSIAKSGHKKISKNSNTFSDRVGELLRNLDSK